MSAAPKGSRDGMKIDRILAIDRCIVPTLCVRVHVCVCACA